MYPFIILLITLLSLDLISQSELELMSISDKNTKISKLYKLVRRVPEDKIDFFYEKINHNS